MYVLLKVVTLSFLKNTSDLNLALNCTAFHRPLKVHFICSFLTQLSIKHQFYPNCQKCQVFTAQMAAGPVQWPPFSTGCWFSEAAGPCPRPGEVGWWRPCPIWAPTDPRTLAPGPWDPFGQAERLGWRPPSPPLPFGAPDTDGLALSSPHRGREARPGGLHLLQCAGGQGGGHGQRGLEHHAGMLRGHPHCEWAVGTPAPSPRLGGTGAEGNFRCCCPVEGQGGGGWAGLPGSPSRRDQAYRRVRAGQVWLRGSGVTDHARGCVEAWPNLCVVS